MRKVIATGTRTSLPEIVLDYIVQELILDENPAISQGPENIDDYVVEMEPEEQDIDLPLTYVMPQEDITDTFEEREYETSDLEEDYTSYVSDEEEFDYDEKEEIYTLSHEIELDSNDPDEQVFVFWQRHIARLPKCLWYMSEER
jgi:hypothetical protein